MRTKFFCVVLCCLFVFLAAPAVSAEDRVSVGTVKNGFMTLYQTEWRAENFNFMLFSVVSREFDEAVGAMLKGTSGFQFAINYNDIIKTILDNSLAVFQPDYELFFKNFYDKYYTFLDINPIIFSREKLKGLYFYEELAEVQPGIIQAKLDNSGEMFSRKLSEELTTPYAAFLALLAGVI